jgi:uncharacterized membrane protein
MGISGYGTHSGGMILFWLIVVALFGVLIYFVAAQARSSKSTNNGSGHESPDEKDDG